MESLIGRLRAAGLTYIQAHEGNETAVIEAAHHSGGLFVGKYIVLPIEAERFLSISESGPAFERFEDEHVGPYYFRLRGDWTWNLYVVYVLDDEAFDRVPAESRHRVESGKRYGRKLVVPFSKIEQTLPVAKLPDKRRDVRQSDPYADWFRSLNGAGLSFCLEPFSGPLLTQYLSGVAPAAPEAKPHENESPAGPASAPSQTSVRSLQFGARYRPYCWRPGETLDFARINLLEGANGAGKTSVLEAIELAFTGKILRNELAKRYDSAAGSGNELWDGRVVLTHGELELELCDIPDANEQKGRQSRFYRQRPRERTRNTALNQLFHQYNYFSSETVYRLCYGEQPDYRQAFARVVFGEELGLIEERWKKYGEEFAEKLPSLRKQAVEKEAELDILRTQIREREKRVDLQVRASIPALKRLLSEASVSYSLPERPADRRELTEWLERLYAHATELDAIALPLKEAGKLQIVAFGQIEAAGSKLAAESAELERKLAASREEAAKLPGLTGLRERLHERERAAVALDARISRIRELAEETEMLQPLFDDERSRQLREKLEVEAAELRRRAGLLERIRLEWGPLADFGFSQERPEEAQRLWETAKELADSALARLRQLTSRISEEEKKSDSAQKLLAQLQSLGRQYAKTHADHGVCPLCGTDHRTAERLAELMETGLRNDETYLRKLREEEQELIRERDRRDAELARLQTELDRFGQLREARAYINANAAELGVEPCPDRFDASQIKSRLAELTRRSEEVRGRLDVLEREAARLDGSGFTMDRIRRFGRLIRSIESETAMTAAGSGYQVRAALAEKESGLSGERRAMAEPIDQLRLDIRRTTEALERLELSRRTAENELREKSESLQRATAMRTASRMLYEKGVFRDDDKEIEGWRAYLTKLLEEIRLLLKTLQPGGDASGAAAELAKAEAALNDARDRLRRCERAVAALSGLRPLSAYIDDFVEANIAAISDLFVRLHSPQEFERLTLAQNELAAVRRGDGQREVRYGIHQMSTGQRTAVILSIFFVMHMSLDTVPNFILLDEPVANMDDLNVLALLDFLRQLTLARGTQIVFTTANPTVAGLFRRKFSIFEDRFRAFHFSRADRQVNVQAETYLPHRESGVPLAT
ncbi:AAA family ATPase [Paenibacillus sp. GYB003]|uniref:AAA family ATPase n=1 Tax=Paenibacillus sp. GYB003 TaxID=2994392 RepID=UPI002F96AB6A